MDLAHAPNVVQRNMYMFNDFFPYITGTDKPFPMPKTVDFSQFRD